MASNGVQTTNFQTNQHPESQKQQQQQQQQRQFHCKECGLNLNSAESLDVHLQYHKENLLNKWALQAAASQGDESNNNKATNMKQREFIPNSVTPSENSDNSIMKKSPEYGSRATPETSVSFGHPPTPQSYHSASSPYQNPPENNFSPNFPSYQTIKQERTSPNSQFQQNYSYPDAYYNVDSPSMQVTANYQQDYLVAKMSNANSYRFDPYSRGPIYDQRKMPNQASSSSPAFPAQPTPSPSPKQCDKCGFVCESAQQLIDHINLNHPPTPAPPNHSYPQSHFQMFPNDIKEEAQSDILDLDSHKVHHVYQEEDKRANGEMNGHVAPHPVAPMLSNWNQHPQRMYMPDQKMYSNGVPHPMPENKLIHGDFMSGTLDGSNAMPQQLPPYRAFENISQQPVGTVPVMGSSPVPNAPVPSAPSTPKGTNWKSNEARRPKTYNCTACNKWFTSSGHLKRHYNTTLHKNAVKSSGQPDPAGMPISAHHHPARESTSSREDANASSPGEESRGEDSMPPTFDRPVPTGGLLQQPPNGPYDRQPAPNINMHHPSNIHHPPLHSPMGHNPAGPMVNSMPNHGSPPNVEAGPSATSNLDSRGLLNFNTASTNPHGFSMSPIMPMDNTGQYQMYPNELAPHVMQTMDTSSPNISGETQILIVQNNGDLDKQPLPSFDEIQSAQKFGLISFDDANVGGLSSVTDSNFAYNPTPNIITQEQYIFLSNNEYQSAVMNSPDGSSEEADQSRDNVSPQVATEFISNQNQNFQYFVVNGETMTNEAGDSPTRPEDAKIKREPEQNPIVSSSMSGAKHVCFECKKPFAKSCYLTQHNKTFHSGAKPFKCGKCGKRYSCEKSHKAHQIKHSGEKPYKCQECPKQFNHKTDLRRHMCVHTGHKPFTCDTCGKGFIRKDHMMKHKDTHTKKTSKALSYRC